MRVFVSGFFCGLALETLILAALAFKDERRIKR